MKIPLSSLANVSISRLRLRSVDLSIYTAEVLLQGHWQTLCADGGAVLSWRALDLARSDLAGLDVRQATLLHMSASHEMIGLDAEVLDPMEVPLGWPLRSSP